MAELAVDAAANNLRPQFFELGCFIRESNNFRRADECEVERVEEQYYVLAFKVAPLKIFEIFTDQGGRFKIRSFFSNCDHV